MAVVRLKYFWTAMPMCTSMMGICCIRHSIITWLWRWHSLLLLLSQLVIPVWCQKLVLGSKSNETSSSPSRMNMNRTLILRTAISVRVKFRSANVDSISPVLSLLNWDWYCENWGSEMKIGTITIDPLSSDSATWSSGFQAFHKDCSRKRANSDLTSPAAPNKRSGVFLVEDERNDLTLSYTSNWSTSVIPPLSGT